MSHGSSIFLIFILIVMLIVIGVALSWGEWEAYLVPLVLSGLIIALGIVQLAREFFAKGETHLAEEEEKAQGNGKVTNLREFSSAVGWLVGFSLSAYLFGFLITIPLGTLIYLRSRGRTWLQSVCVALTIGGFVYGMFEIGFQFYLYRGLIWESIFGM